MPQAMFPFFPAGVTHITPWLAFACENGRVTYFTANLPVGAGDVRYFIEAEDRLGNLSRGALERIWLA